MPWRSGYGHHGRVFDICFSTSGHRILSASEDGTARVWSMDNVAITQESCVSGHRAEVMRASWSKDESMIVTASADTTAKVWRLRDGYASECTAVLGGHLEELYCSEWVRDSELVLTASGNELLLWDVRKQEKMSHLLLQSTSVHAEMPEMWRKLSVFGCVQHPTEPLAASPCCDGNVHIVSLRNRALQSVCMLPVAEDLNAATMCSAAAFSADGSLLVVGTRGGALLVYCTTQWKLLHTLELPAGVTGCVWDTQVERPSVLVATSASVLRWQPSTGSKSTMHSRWPTRSLLCVACRRSGGRELVVASGETVSEAQDGLDEQRQLARWGGMHCGAPRDSAGGRTPAEALQSAGNAGEAQGGMFSAVGLEVGGRQGRRAARGSGHNHMEQERLGNFERVVTGGTVVENVPDARGRSPLEVWELEDF